MEGRIGELEVKRASGILGERLGKKRIIVGPGANPIWIGFAEDLKALFTVEFWILVDLWRKFRYGYRDCEDPSIIDAMVLIQEHFESYFSGDSVTHQYLGAIIKRLDARR